LVEEAGWYMHRRCCFSLNSSPSLSPFIVHSPCTTKKV
jgi:hypothetical protein